LYFIISLYSLINASSSDLAGLQALYITLSPYFFALDLAEYFACL
jgi:hypothetical protein